MNPPEHFESYIQLNTPKILFHNHEMSHVIQVICNIVLLDKSAEDNTRKVGKWGAIRLEGIVWLGIFHVGIIILHPNLPLNFIQNIAQNLTDS